MTGVARERLRDELSAMKPVLPVLIRRSEQWQRVGINDIECGQLRGFAVELGWTRYQEKEEMTGILPN